MMLETLYEVERLLPNLLEIEEGWKGLFAGAERPNLTRVWRQWGENCIHLHSFGSCGPGEVFPHPHPWDSAIRAWSDYDMGVGYGSDPSTPPEIFSRMMMRPGSAYEIIGPAGWHWVRPAGAGSDSVMVAGPPVYPQNRVRSNTPARGLTQIEILAQLERFKRHYPR